MPATTKDRLIAAEHAENLRLAELLGGELIENDDDIFTVRITGTPGISWASIRYSAFFGGEYALTFTDGDCQPCTGSTRYYKTANQVCAAVARWRAKCGY